MSFKSAMIFLSVGSMLASGAYYVFERISGDKPGQQIHGGNSALAQEEIRKAQASEPGGWKANYHMGLAMLRFEKYNAAINYLGKAQSGNPEEIGILNALGEAHYMIGRFDTARDYLISVLDIDPSNTDALDLMEDIASEEGK